MSTLKRSKLLTQKELEERRRKRIYRDLRSPRKKVGGPSPDFTNSREISDPISRKKNERDRSKATPGVNPKFIPIKKQEKELNKGYKSGGVVLKGKKVGCQIK